MGWQLACCSPARPCRGAQTTPTCPPPKTRVDDISDRNGKTTVVDPYRWLEDQESKETQEWIKAQDRCTEAVLSNLPGRQAIVKRLSELSRIDSYGLPKELALGWTSGEQTDRGRNGRIEHYVLAVAGAPGVARSGETVIPAKALNHTGTT
jgi:hypothetical protein